MALLSIDDLKSRARTAYAYRMLYKSAGGVLEEEIASAPTFDVFVSHSYQDAKLDNEALLGLFKTLKDLGYNPYIDWIVDQELDRSNVTYATAEFLRLRMRQSKCLFFASSENSTSSKWMPWELGYYDGYRDRVAILPLTGGYAGTFNGQEYLGMYPIVDVTSGTIWIHSHKDPSKYIRFDQWLNGQKP